MTTAATPVAVEITTGQPALSVPVPALTATGTKLVYSRRCALLGWSIGAGATATVVTLSDGRTKDGKVVGLVSLAAAGAETTWLGDFGILCQGGVAVSATKATVASVLYVLDLGP